MPVTPAPEAIKRNLVLQVEKLHFLHNDMCSSSPEEGRSRLCGRPDFQPNCRETEASEEVVAGTILVHSVPVISLFDSDASHYYISTSFIMMHSIPCNDMDTQWEKMGL